MEEKTELAARTLSIKKTFDAPIDLVWKAWTQSEHIAQWWGPKGMKVDIIAHEFKVGGKWKYEMAMPDGSKFTCDGVYSEIVSLKKIVSTANFRPMTEGVEIRALFEKKGDQTEFVFSVVHATEEYCRQQEKMGFYNGWGSTLNRLAEYMKIVRK